MPEIISVSKVVLPYRPSQNELKEFARATFSDTFEDIERLLESFDNAKIDTRNCCVPVEYFYSQKTFEEKNKLYVKTCLKFSIQAIEECLEESGINKDEITDIIFISTTGLSTPSIDAMIVNEMKLHPNINRMPVWGLGCAGGVAGIAKANAIAKSNPEAMVLLVAAELCSLTFIRNDVSKSNFIATGLFSDGISAVLIKGDDYDHSTKNKFSIKIIDSRSKLYYDSLDVMGWDILNEGFKVVFSKDIPSIVNKNVRDDIVSFLEKHDLVIDDVKNYIAHPGGVKVMDAYVEALDIDPGLLKNSKKILRDYGNMSSATVLYVLDTFVKNGFEEGYGLMISLGPGFSSEMALLQLTVNS